MTILMQFILICVGIARYVGKPPQFEATGAKIVEYFALFSLKGALFYSFLSFAMNFLYFAKFIYRMSNCLNIYTAGSPPLRLLVEAVTNVTDWHTLGRNLNLTNTQLENIHVTYHVHGVERLKTEMFDAWLKSSPSASWSDLISALKSMNKHTVASDIAAHYAAGHQSPTQGNRYT